MAYDESLADRLLAELADDGDVTARKMFGGYCAMWRGNMLAGVIGEDLMVRVGADAHDALLADPAAREMDFTHRPMKGMLIIDGSGLTDGDLAMWLGRAKDFVGTLPPK